jgi:Copper type II ascorbate-dependent monooxygenase, C-terminal domain
MNSSKNWTRAGLGLGLVLFASLTAVWATRAPGAGETRSPSHAHTLEAARGNTNVPPILDFIPTYAEHVKPILDANCVSCHVEGGIAPFALTDYSSAKNQARGAYLAVAAKRMPPFPPGGESPRLLHELKLTPEEIAILANWSWSGAPSGDLNRPKAATPRAIPQVRADVKLDIGTAFKPNAALSDEYRCFILDPKLTTDRFLSGYNILPGNRKAVHHVLLYELPASLEGEAKGLERGENDGRQGYTCFGGPRVGNGLQPIGAWAPGSAGVSFPAGTGARLRADSKLLAQVHYNLSNGSDPDRTAVHLELAPEGEKLKPLMTFAPTAPVEIPCAGATPDDSKHPCSRSAAYARVLELNNSRGNQRRRDGNTLKSCNQDLNSYLNPVDVTRIATSCEYFVPARFTVYGLLGHMHYLGKSVKIEILSPGGSRRVLLDIPNWDFHWQGFYWLRDPVSVKSGDKLRISCVFDNSKANQPYLDGTKREPQYRVWGEGTGEEMCLSYVQATLEGI